MMRRFRVFPVTTTATTASSCFCCLRTVASSTSTSSIPTPPQAPNVMMQQQQSNVLNNNNNNNRNINRPAFQILLEACEEAQLRNNNNNNCCVRWLDISDAIPSAIATRETDCLIAAAFQKFEASSSHNRMIMQNNNNRENENDNENVNATATRSLPEKLELAAKIASDTLTLEIAVGLLQSSQYSDIESRSTEMYERNNNNNHNNSFNNKNKEGGGNSSESRRLGLALFVSKGIIPLSFRQRCSDGSVTVRLLQEMLFHPSFDVSSSSSFGDLEFLNVNNNKNNINLENLEKLQKYYSNQALLIDAAGQVLEKLRSTISPESTRLFFDCVSIVNGRLFDGERQLESMKRDLIKKENFVTFSSNNNNNEITSTSSSNNNNNNNVANINIDFQAERQMVRESWRKFQKSIKFNPIILATTVHCELEQHLNLVRNITHNSSSSSENENNNKDEQQQQKSSSSSVNLHLSEDEQLDELSLFDFLCALDSMNLISSYCLRRLPSHPSSSFSFGHQKQNQEEEEEAYVDESATTTTTIPIQSVIMMEKLISTCSKIRAICPTDSPEWLSLHDATTIGGILSRHLLETCRSGVNANCEDIFKGLIQQQLSPNNNDNSDGNSNNDNNDETTTSEQGATTSSSSSSLPSTDTVYSVDEEMFDESSSTSTSFSPIVTSNNMRSVLLIGVLHICNKAHSLQQQQQYTSKGNSSEKEKELLLLAQQAKILLQSIVKHHFPRGTNQNQNQQKSSSSSSSLTKNISDLEVENENSSSDEINNNFDSNNNNMNLSSSFSSRYNYLNRNKNNNNENSDDNNNDNNANSNSNTISNVAVPSPDYDLLQHAHVAVIDTLINATTTTSSSSSSQEEDNNSGSGVGNLEAAEQCYTLISAHKYYGVKVTSKMMLPMLKTFSPLADSRVFNAIDVCTLFSGNSITVEVLAEALKTCAAAGDHHRARVLLQLLRSDVPGIVMKLPQDAIDALVELGVLPAVAPTFFESTTSSTTTNENKKAEQQQESSSSSTGCLPLVM